MWKMEIDDNVHMCGSWTDNNILSGTIENTDNKNEDKP